MADVRITTPEGKVSPSTGIHIGPARRAGDPANYRPGSTTSRFPTQVTPTYFQSLLQSLVQPDNAAVSAPMGNLGGNNGGGGRGGGGGGGPSPEQVRAWAGELFNVDSRPYYMRQQAINNQIAQANAYNPDFAGMQKQYDQRLQANETDRAAQVKQRLQALADLGQRLAGQQGQVFQGAMADLTAQGINPNAYVNQASQMAAERTAGLSNQGQYMGQLDALAAQGLNDYRNAGGLVTQGAQANLANNRGVLLNQLAQQTAQVQADSAREQQAMNQARREFLIKYGVS